MIATNTATADTLFVPRTDPRWRPTELPECRCWDGWEGTADESRLLAREVALQRTPPATPIPVTPIPADDIDLMDGIAIVALATVPAAQGDFRRACCAGFLPRAAIPQADVAVLAEMAARGELNTDIIGELEGTGWPRRFDLACSYLMAEGDAHTQVVDRARWIVRRFLCRYARTNAIEAVAEATRTLEAGGDELEALTHARDAIDLMHRAERSGLEPAE